jgi:hypothetical protein
MSSETKPWHTIDDIAIRSDKYIRNLKLTAYEVNTDGWRHHYVERTDLVPESTSTFCGIAVEKVKDTWADLGNIRTGFKPSLCLKCKEERESAMRRHRERLNTYNRLKLEEAAASSS